MNMHAPLAKLLVAITMLVFLALPSQVVAAAIRFDFLPEGQRTFPVSLIFEGELLQPPRAIERATATKADHSSPEAVMASMLKRGQPTKATFTQLCAAAAPKEFVQHNNLNLGSASALMYASDLTEEYAEFNQGGM